MRHDPLSILFALALLLAGPAIAAEPAPPAAGARFPNINASLADGFFGLAEQQARGVLLDKPNPTEERAAVLLLSHALWGQQRPSELHDLLAAYDDQPGYVYWRARADYERKRYAKGLGTLAASGERLANSGFHPAALRLQGHMEQELGNAAAAEATYIQFAETYPNHRQRIENLFALAAVYVLQNKLPEAIATYEGLAEETDRPAAQRAQLKLAHVLYTQGAVENRGRSRALLTELATNVNVRLAYRIDAYVDRAALEEKAADRDAAKQALREAIALSPDARQRVPLKQALVRVLLRDGNTAGALKLLEECRAEAPNQTIAATLQLEKAGALLQAQQFPEADAAYQVYIDVADDSGPLAQAYFGKGLALWALERFSESAGVLDKALKGLHHSAERADALFKAGDAYYRAGQYERAAARYHSFIEQFAAHENIPNALYQLGLTQAEEGQHDAALETFLAVEADYADSPFAEQAALRAADVLRAVDQWEEALAKYTTIGAAYTNVSVVAHSLHQRGLLLYRLGRFAAAQQVFESVVADYATSADAPQASYMRGFCLYLQGQVEEAVETCHAFIRQYPDSQWTPEVIFWLAEQYYNQGNPPAAEPLFVRIATDFKTHRLAPRALYWAGRAAAEQDNYVQAIERFSGVAKNYPHSEVLPQTRFAQGDALSELGEFSRAILAFEEIIKHYPDSHLVNAAWGRKGDCQFSLAVDNPARYGEAMNSFQAILDRPSSPVGLKLQAEYKLGRCLEKTQVPDKAFSRYMNVVYTFIHENVEHSPYTVMWFTRSAFGAATLKERGKAWVEAVHIYERVVEANVPAQDEAVRRAAKIKNDNWLLFQQTEEKDYVGTDG